MPSRPLPQPQRSQRAARLRGAADSRGTVRHSQRVQFLKQGKKRPAQAGHVGALDPGIRRREKRVVNRIWYIGTVNARDGALQRISRSLRRR